MFSIFPSSSDDLYSAVHPSKWLRHVHCLLGSVNNFIAFLYSVPCIVYCV